MPFSRHAATLRRARRLHPSDTAYSTRTPPMKTTKMPTEGPPLMHRSPLVLCALVTAFVFAGNPLLAAGTGSNTPVLAADSANHYGLGDLTVDVLANDIDPDGEALTLTSVSPSGSCPESARPAERPRRGGLSDKSACGLHVHLLGQRRKRSFRLSNPHRQRRQVRDLRGWIRIRQHERLV